MKVQLSWEKKSLHFPPHTSMNSFIHSSFFFLFPHFLASHPTAAPLLPPNGRFTLFINEHTLHRLFTALLCRNIHALWLPNSIFLPEERPPASISLPGSELWAPYLILATVVSAACRSPPCQPFFSVFLFPPTCCSCSHDGLQTFTVALLLPVQRELVPMWPRRHSGKKKQVNVISLGTPAWALCCCRLIDFCMSPGRSFCVVCKICRSICQKISTDWSFKNKCQLGEI